MKTDLKYHEAIGLLLLFLSGTLLGFGLYATMWGAIRPLLNHSVDYILTGKELLIFPLFYGLGFVLLALGRIELKEAMPGKRK